MEILIGDVHGSLKQFLYPFYSNGFYDNVIIKNNEIIFEHLNLHGNKLIFVGDIFYKGEHDCIIANTLSKLILDNYEIEWLLGNRDLIVFAKLFKENLEIDDIEIDDTSHSYKDSPFLNRYDSLNKERLKRLIIEKRIKVITRLKNNLLVSHAAITQNGFNELKNILETRIINNINPDIKNIKQLTLTKNNQLDSIEDLNIIFNDVDNINLYCSRLEIFWNKHIFEAIEECIIGHETFINEYPKEAIVKIQKYGIWLTDEYISMNVQCKQDRIKQFLLKEVHYGDIIIKTNIHHIDCNCFDNPCCFILNDNKWSYSGPDDKLSFSNYEFNERVYKVLSE